MIKHISSLGAEVIGINRRGRKVEGCSKIITFDKIDEASSTTDWTKSLGSNEKDFDVNVEKTIKIKENLNKIFFKLIYISYEFNQFLFLPSRRHP